MRVPRTLGIYLAREIGLYAVLAFAAILAVLVSQNLLRRLDDLVVVGFEAADLWVAVQLLVPVLSAYATPIAFLFGVSLAVSRLASDSEILAMRASGLGLRALLAPPLILGLGVSLLTGWIMNVVEPPAQREMRTMFKSVAARGGVLKAGEFRDLADRVVFVESRDRDNRLRGILIEDTSDAERPFLIFAKRGQMQVDAEAGAIRLALEGGEIHVDPGAGAASRYERIHFEALDYVLHAEGLVSGQGAPIRPREMSRVELHAALARLRVGELPKELREKDPVEYELQLHRRAALPVAPLLFALIATPLALRRTGNARSWGLFVSLLLIFLYYSLLTFAQLLAREGWLAAGAALWIPNGLVALSAWALLHRVRRGGLL